MEQTTSEPKFSTTFEKGSDYIVCIEFGSNGCLLTQSPPRGISMAVPEAADAEFPKQFTCEGETALLGVSVLGGKADPENDPNGDGLFGWYAPIVPWELGFNSGLVMDAFGCSYQQTFELTAINCDTVNTADGIDYKPYRIYSSSTIRADSDLRVTYYTMDSRLLHTEEVKACQVAYFWTGDVLQILQIADTTNRKSYIDRALGLRASWPYHETFTLSK